MTKAEKEEALALASNIADFTCRMINTNKHLVKHPYPAQWLLEETIKVLEKRV